MTAMLVLAVGAVSSADPKVTTCQHPIKMQHGRDPLVNTLTEAAAIDALKMQAEMCRKLASMRFHSIVKEAESQNAKS